ncbi:MAG: biopolymer transporter ExbD [Gammaproteobacteria bacterium]|nr:biopolymer transporter ExbD [Gammaproteobacteria bacterium]
MKFPHKSRTRPNVHLTSLIDIVFLLLIFFLLSSNFVDQQGIPIKTPEIDNTSTDILPEITINISEKGDLFYNGIKVNEPVLHKLLVKSLVQSSTKNVAIRADRRVQYDDVVRVIDIAKGAGAKDFLLITQHQ